MRTLSKLQLEIIINEAGKLSQAKSLDIYALKAAQLAAKAARAVGYPLSATLVEYSVW